MATESQGTGRFKQKRRTRAAVLSAAMALIERGETPTVAEAAEAADVSRRTAYRYFPTQDQLLTEAVLETLRPGVQRNIDLDAGPMDPEARLDALVRSLHIQTLDNEPLLRTMIRLTVGQEPRQRSDEQSEPRRGYRRIDWIESALKPLEDQMDEAIYQRLVSALCLCIGIESLLVLRDVRGLDPDEVLSVSRWAARTLLRASLQD